MASVRQIIKTGKWELTVRHPLLPKGRKFFTFDTEQEATAYGQQWDMLVAAGAPPPQSLLEKPRVEGTLGHVIRTRANAPQTAVSDQPTLKLLLGEVGNVKLSAFTFAWVKGWVQAMKLQQNLAPSSIRKRVGSLSRAVDEYAREMPDIQLANPLKLLPDRYSAYSDQDKRAVESADKEAKADQVRDRRLLAGEEEKITAVLSGEKRPDRERAIGNPDMLVLFKTIIYTGMRLKEAYTLRRENVDLTRKVIRAQKSKLWHGKVAFKDVPIRPELYPILSEYVAASSGELLFPFWDGVEPERKATNRLSQAFSRVFTYAGCEGLTEHDLRHEATCRWLELRGKDGQWIFREEEIHRIMGWAPGSKMATVYASFRGDTLANRLWD